MPSAGSQRVTVTTSEADGIQSGKSRQLSREGSSGVATMSSLPVTIPVLNHPLASAFR